METQVVLAVDDDPIQLDLIRVAAKSMRYPPVEIVTAENVSQAVNTIRTRHFDMVISDQRLPDGQAMDVLRVVQETNPLIPVIVITAYESVSEAVELLRNGARDYRVKPLRGTDIQQLLTGTLEWHIQRSPADNDQVDAPTDLHDIEFSDNELMVKALSMARQAAGSDASVLIHGESGTGKELVAHMIHKASPRKDNPFVPVSVAALPETLVESEMFGHRKGAFTGASEDRRGLFEEAHSGTLFVDEIGDIPLTVQVKLLRALQGKQIQRIGESHPTDVDVRIVAATNRDLTEMIARNQFREDLYYRINVIPIELPPLRDRKQDIPALVERFIQSFSVKNGKTIKGISKEALNVLMRHSFPGNVRELENLVERAVVLSRSDKLGVSDLPSYITQKADEEGFGAEADAAGSLDEQLTRLERKLILEALRDAGGNQSRAAVKLGITERRLRSRLERLGISNPYA